MFENKDFEKKILEEYKDIVEYVGWKSQVEAHEICANCLAGVATYLPLPNHMNLRSNKVYEYMVSKIPVIYSNFPDWLAKLEKYRVGLSVNPMNVDDIASKIQFIADNPSISREMGLNGWEFVCNNYNWEKEEVKLLEVYEKFNFV